MNTRTLALACFTVFAALMLLWFGRSSFGEGDGAQLAPQLRPGGSPAPASEPETGAHLATVPKGPANREDTAVPAAESPNSVTRLPKDDAVTGQDLAPLNVQVIDSLSGERIPFLSFTARDARGETLSGCTDADGRVRSHDELATGVVHVEITIGAHIEDQASGVRLRSRPARSGASVAKPNQPHAGDPKEPSVWRLKAQRVVPIAIELSAELMDQADVWLASTADDAQVQRIPLRVGELGNVAPDQLMGATHVFELASAGIIEARPGRFSVSGGLLEVEDWMQRVAGQRVMTRQLYVMVASGGELLFASALVPELPLMGEAPIRLTPAPSTAGALPSAFLQGLYASELNEQAATIAALAARQDFRLSGVVVSNSGEFQGPVFVRANPMGEEGPDAVERRKQWITASWKRGADGRWTAPFTLDELDAGRYRIIALTGNGTKVSDSPYSVNTTDPEPLELSFTVLD